MTTKLVALTAMPLQWNGDGAHAFVCVLEGSVVTQLKGGQQATLTPGPLFEGPDDVHIVDRERKRYPASEIPGGLDQGQW